MAGSLCVSISPKLPATGPHKRSHNIGLLMNLTYAVIYKQDVHNDFTLTRIVGFNDRQYQPGWQCQMKRRATAATGLVMTSQLLCKTLGTKKHHLCNLTKV